MSWWTPECLPDGRRQAGDRHLNFHKDWDNLGLGGGGQKPFWQSGRYSFGVNTSCGWTLTVESIPLPAGKYPGRQRPSAS